MTSTNTAVRARLRAATLSFLMLVVSAIFVSGTAGPAGIQATTTDVVANQWR